MNGLPPHHPMFGRNGVPPPAHHYSHPAYADALLNSRYAAAAAGGMDPLLLQQEMRRQEMLAASGGYAAAAAAAAGHHHYPPPHHHAPNPASALVAARREEELVRLHDAHNRIMEAELAARAMRDRVAVAQVAQAQAVAQQNESYSIERIVALQEQQAVRHQREIEKLKQAELSEQSGRAFGGLLHHHPSAAVAGPDRFMDGGVALPSAHPYGRAMSSASNSAAHPPPPTHSPNQIAEEMAFRGRMQRRMLEEEAIKQRHAQHQAALNSQQAMMAHAAGGRNEAASAEREHLTRLLQLQQMSDEDLIRRAAEVQNAQSAATLCDSLDRNKSSAAMEQQLMEARLLRGSGLPSQRYPGGGGGAARAGESSDPRQQGLDMIDQAYADVAVARKFSGGSEKQPAGDRHATPVQKKQDKQSTSPKEGKDGKPLRYFNNGIEVDMEGNPLPGQEPPAPATSNGKPSPVINNLASLDNNIIAKFLTVVVSRVPEIAPAVADLLPDVGDPMLLKREFPNVVDATLAELRSIQERFADSGDNNIDLHRRVTNCIAAIEPYKVDLSTAGGMVPLPQLPPGVVSPSALAAGMMRQALPLPLPEPSLDPGNCQPLMPNNPMRLHHHPLQGPVVSRPQYFPNPEELAMAQHVHALNSNRMEGTFTPLVKTPDKIKPKPESPSDDVPMMAAYKTTKKIEKIAKKQKKAKKKKKNRKPKLVHHALFRGALDMNSVMRKAALAKQREKAQQQWDRAESESESCEDGKKSMPMKKRKISEEAQIDEADDSIHPISKVTRKNNKDNNKRNPRGALLHQIFGTKTTSPGASSKKENTGPNSKRPVQSISKVREGTAKSSNEDSTNSVVTEESEDQAEDHAADSASQANADVDSHYDAANVLLGLMGK